MIKKKVRKLHKRLLALWLVVAIFLGTALGFVYEKPVYALRFPTTITLVQAKKLAINNSKALEKLRLQIEAKEGAYISAVKSIEVRRDDFGTLRWAPLLNFSFRDWPKLDEEFEFDFKPIQLQYQIKKLYHKYEDTKLSEYEKVINLYVDIVVYEKRIEFNEQRAALAEDTLRKNRVRLLSGDATQNDVKTMEKSLDAINKRLSADSTALITAKKKMSNILKLDVTSNYRFQDPFLEAKIPRSLLSYLTQYTLDRDDSFYDICMEETLAQIAVQTNYRLLYQNYGSRYMYIIEPYIKSALNDQEVDISAFKKKYKEFTKRINEDWEGWFLFIIFPLKLEWLQGETDGDRYIENDPYSAQTAVLEYLDAVEARRQGETELKEAVEDAFNNYVSIKNSYESYVEQVKDAEVDIEKARILNRAGELEYAEYKSQLDSFEELQNSQIDSMKEYTQTLISFDRLTCGGVSSFLGDLIGDFDPIGGGQSYVDPEYADGAYYYIEPIIQRQQFKLGVSFPDDYDIDVTEFELWIDNTLIGERTSVNNTIRHLTFDLNDVNRVFLRFYNEGEFVDDVEIDPLVSSGPLDLIKSYNPRENTEIGEYVLVYNGLRNQYTLTLKMIPSENIASYRVKDSNGAYLIDSTMRDINDTMTYLNTISNSMDVLTFEFYDASGNMLYEGYADTTLMKLHKRIEE